MTNVGFKRLTDTAVIPTKAHVHDSGFDLYADETVIIEPGQTVVVKTGIAVVLPVGHEATVRPRSGITSRTKLRVQLGTIDFGYIGDIGIIVDNIGTDEQPYRAIVYKHIDGTTKETEKHLRKSKHYGDHTEHHKVPYDTYIIRKGDKLAQLVVSPVATFAGVEITDLDDTTRGSNGFGSTGV